MAEKKGESYNNLIDICIEFELDPNLGGNSGDMFKKLLADYFFKNECAVSKQMEQFFENFEAPDFLNEMNNLLDIEISKLAEYVNGETINDSLAGKIMLSKVYLKNFYPGQNPSFGALPEDIKFELVDKIKEKNSTIIAAFEKMKKDREADKNRKIITLISLIIKNLYIKTGRPLNKLHEPAEKIIREIFPNADEKFLANQKQLADINDDTKIKELIKTFFMIKQYKDIEEIGELYKKELDRYKRRALRF